ncbi:nitroreductase [Hyphobacterium sp. CCMP332]|nr:nitroreductase [Hyphobacterium sp. CCMP332]
MQSKFISEYIKERRSLYPAQYSNKKVDDAIVREILENANWAPSHKRTYPWRFTVFSGDGLQKLAHFQSELYKKKSTENGNFDKEKYEKLNQKPLMASHVIAIGMKRDIKKSVPEIEEIASVACAVQNMHLTTSAYGLGAYWGTGGITYFEEAKAFFDLEENDKLMGFFFIGELKIEKWPKGIRKPYEDFVKWIS